MEPRDLLRILQRNWALILALVLVAGALSTAYSLLKTPQYSATAKAVLQPDSATSTVDLQQGTSYVQSIVKTYADIATTPYVLQPVITKLNLSDTVSQLASRVSATVPDSETVIEVSTTDESPVDAQRISNAVVQQLQSAVQQVAPEPANRTASVELQVVQQATTPVSPFSPNVPLNAALGLVFGLVLGLIAGFVRNRFDTGIATERDVQLVTDYPVIGTVGFRRSAGASPILSDTQRSYARVEEFNALRSEVLRANPERRSISLVIAAPTAVQGTSTTAANLAVTLASSERRVLLVDANLRHPAVDGIFGLDDAAGLTDALRTGDAERVIQPTTHDGLWALTAGPRVDEPGRLLDSISLETMLKRLRSLFDVVVIDAPPLLTDDESLRLARVADGVLVVTAAGRSDRLRLRRALQDVDDAGGWVLGVVITMAGAAAPTQRGRRGVRTIGREQTEVGGVPEPVLPLRAR